MAFNDISNMIFRLDDDLEGLLHRHMSEDSGFFPDFDKVLSDSHTTKSDYGYQLFSPIPQPSSLHSPLQHPDNQAPILMTAEEFNNTRFGSFRTSVASPTDIYDEDDNDHADNTTSTASTTSDT